jgi:hypothetical protein
MGLELVKFEISSIYGFVGVIESDGKNVLDDFAKSKGFKDYRSSQRSLGILDFSELKNVKMEFLTHRDSTIGSCN